MIIYHAQLLKKFVAYLKMAYLETMFYTFLIFFKIINHTFKDQ